MNQDTPGKPEAHALEINGARLPCVIEGDGPTVLLLHGALADHRMWARHHAALREQYRVVSYTQRYFGDAPWESDWPPFGIQTHAADLIAFVEALAVGSVHLVAWSYAGHIALHVALERPDLLDSVFIYEPGVPTYVQDPAALEAFAADANAMFGPVFAAVQGDNDLAEGVRRLIDGSGQQVGYYDAQPPQRKALQMANARTLPPQLAQPDPPQIDCAQLGTLMRPACIAWGAQTRPLFRIVSQAAAQCIPNCTALSIPGANHMWPDESPTDFCTTIHNFIQSLCG